MTQLTRSDGPFSAVRTTGVFCRLTCGGRPLPQNIQTGLTAREALFTGYRPCKRCRPLADNLPQPDWLTRLLALTEDSETRLGEAELGALGITLDDAESYLSEHHAVSLDDYQRSRRLRPFLAQLREGSPRRDLGLMANGGSARGPSAPQSGKGRAIVAMRLGRAPWGPL